MSSSKIVNGRQIADYSSEIAVLQYYLNNLATDRNDAYDSNDFDCICLDKALAAVVETMVHYQRLQKQAILLLFHTPIL